MMNRNRKIFDRLASLASVLNLAIGFFGGVAGSFVFGALLGMGLPGYLLGFFVGIAVVWGCISF